MKLRPSIWLVFKISYNETEQNSELNVMYDNFETSHISVSNLTDSNII